jgi:hypothetical protein
MADRARYLARHLIARMANLEAAARAEGTASIDRRQRRTLVEKVLAVELGLTDSTIVALVESAVPHVAPDDRGLDREVAALADFLRRHLGAQLTET